MNLSFDKSYNLACRLTLNCGREVILQALDQSMTYAGQLEGVPSGRTNDWHLGNLLQRAKAHCYEGAAPHLISPARRDYLRVPGDMVGRGLPRHVPEWLPEVTCIATFKHSAPVRDPAKHLSVLTVVWFQDHYALPIQERSFRELVAIDWDAIATDFEY